jgi:hypothetical protein
MAVEDVDVPESDDDGVVDGVVDGLVDGVESPPMFGQSPAVWVVAAFSSIVAAGVVDVDFAAEPDEFVAAWATAPPASRAETAKVAMTCLERVTIFRSPPFRGCVGAVQRRPVRATCAPAQSPLRLLAVLSARARGRGW